jgi:hypothetical protein
MFDHWVLDGENVGSENELFFTMDAHRELEVVFNLKPPIFLSVQGSDD